MNYGLAFSSFQKKHRVSPQKSLSSPFTGNQQLDGCRHAKLHAAPEFSLAHPHPSPAGGYPDLNGEITIPDKRAGADFAKVSIHQLGVTTPNV